MEFGRVAVISKEAQGAVPQNAADCLGAIAMLPLCLAYALL